MNSIFFFFIPRTKLTKMATPYRGYLSGASQNYLEYKVGYYDKKIPYAAVSVMEKVVSGSATILLIVKEDGTRYALDDNINFSEKTIDLYKKSLKTSLIDGEKICGLRFTEIIGIRRIDDEEFRVLIMAPDEKKFLKYISNADLETVKSRMTGASDGEIISTNGGKIVMRHFLHDDEKTYHHKNMIKYGMFQIFNDYGPKKYVIFKCDGRSVIAESSTLIEKFNENYNKYASLFKKVEEMKKSQTAYNSAGCRGIPMQYRQDWVDELEKLDSME